MVMIIWIYTYFRSLNFSTSLGEECEIPFVKKPKTIRVRMNFSHTVYCLVIYLITFSYFLSQLFLIIVFPSANFNRDFFSAIYSHRNLSINILIDFFLIMSLCSMNKQEKN